MPRHRLRLLDDLAVEDLLSALVGPGDRCRRSLWLVLCAGDAPVQPCVVDDLPASLGWAERLDCLEAFVSVLETFDDPRLLVAVTRPGGRVIEDVDRHWFHAVHEACRGPGIDVVGIWVVTARGERRLRLDDAGFLPPAGRP